MPRSLSVVTMMDKIRNMKKFRYNEYNWENEREQIVMV